MSSEKASRPCWFQAACSVGVGIAALPQCEPEPVLNGTEVEGPPDPALSGRATNDRIDAGDGLALLVGRDGCLSLVPIHHDLHLFASYIARVKILQYFTRV